MVSWKEFTLESLQLAIFTPDKPEFVTGRAVAVILQKFGAVFDGEMQSIPLPMNAPPEVPRVILRSGDKRWKLNMGPTRIDMSWIRDDQVDPVNPLKMLQECLAVVEHYAKEAKPKPRVGRLGLVITRACHAEFPAEELIARFCNEDSRGGPLKRSANFMIENHKVYRPTSGTVDFDLNSKIRCRNGQRKRTGQPVISVLHDLNTLAGEARTRSFEPPDLRVFFTTALHESNDVLQLYFPS